MAARNQFANLTTVKWNERGKGKGKNHLRVITFLTEQSTVESNVQCIGYSHNFVSVYDCFGPVITRTNSSV